MTKRRIYMDHAATTYVKPAVLEAMLPFFTENFGNASSIHTRGQAARSAIDRARDQVAAAINALRRDLLHRRRLRVGQYGLKGVAESYAKRAITSSPPKSSTTRSCTPANGWRKTGASR